MDLHKPKPWHGVREFLKEYLIIVVGVLTALGAEQTAELLHRREAVAEARRALDAEVRVDLFALQLTASQVDCTERRLDELERWRLSFSAGKPLSIRGPMGSPVTANFRMSVWRVASANAVVLMPFEDRVAYGHLYDGFENNGTVRRVGLDVWYDLSEYVGARQLTDDQLRHIGVDIARLRVIDSALKQNWASLSQSARGMGLAPATHEPMAAAAQAEMAANCSPIVGD